MNSPDTVGRVTTRGYYDRRTGKALRIKKYSVYPPNLLKKLIGLEEVAVMVHGMRNASTGAASKVRTASERLHNLGYDHTMIAFSYDSDVVGAHLWRSHRRVLHTARVIAQQNGRHLAAFLGDFAEKSPRTAVRLLGHSLGSEVILSAIRSIYDAGIAPPIKSVHLFAASATRRDVESTRPALDAVVSDFVKNYYYTNDEVLSWGHTLVVNPYPVGLNGAGFDTKKFRNIPVRPKNHRFVSYAEALESFP